MKNPLAAALVLLVLGVVALAYFSVGWSRMESVCTADPPGSTRDTSQVSFDWSWSPTGFQCTYADGQVETSLWF